MPDAGGRRKGEIRRVSLRGPAAGVLFGARGLYLAGVFWDTDLFAGGT